MPEITQEPLAGCGVARRQFLDSLQRCRAGQPFLNGDVEIGVGGHYRRIAYDARRVTVPMRRNRVQSLTCLIVLRRVLPTFGSVVKGKKLPVDDRHEGVQVDQRLLPSLGFANAPSYIVRTGSLPQCRSDATNDGSRGANERLHEGG